jgi:hypothetical protein
VIDGPLGGPVVREWLESLRERLEHEMGELRAIPGVTVRVQSAPVGSCSDFQGHDVRVEVTLANGESLVLSVTAGYLTTLPRVCADVAWGHGNVVASTWDVEMSSQWPVATQENVDYLQRDLARLLAAMRESIAHGRPGRRQGEPIHS